MFWFWTADRTLIATLRLDARHRLTAKHFRVTATRAKPARCSASPSVAWTCIAHADILTTFSRTFLHVPGKTRKRRGGRASTWRTGMKELALFVALVGAARFPIRPTRDEDCSRLEMLRYCSGLKSGANAAACLKNSS